MGAPAPARRPGRVLPAAPDETRKRPSRDAVSLLTVFLVIGFAIPAPLIFKPLGGAGTPADLVALGLLLWWGLAKLGAAQGVDRGHQPVRVALLVLVLAALCSVAGLFLRPFSGEEASGAYRGLILIGALVGLALLAADGISSLDRLHTLMRRFVAGVSLVAAVGLVQWTTGFNPAATLTIPGLVRNVDLTQQSRSNFVRVQSTTVHPIELGSLLGIALPIAVSYAFLARDRRTKWLRWAQVGLIAAVIPMALTRTGVIAAAIGLVVIALDWTWRRRGRALAVVAAAVVAMRLAIPGLVGSIIALFGNFSEDSSTQDRAGRWQVAGHYFELHPWFGMGLNTFFAATGRYFDNQYLGTATELGALGLAAWLLLFLIMAFTARGARRRAVDPETRALAQALVGVALTMMVIFMTADMMSYDMEMGMFFLLFGATGALWRLTGGQPRPTTDQPRSDYTSPLGP